MKLPYLAAALQFNPRLHAQTENIRRLYVMAEQAAQNGARLIVTPEMATTGYHFHDRAAIEKYVDTVPGATTEIFSRLARKYNVYIVIGMPEVDPETGFYFNSAALVGPEGYIGKYRKMHLWEAECHWAVWGNLGVPVYDTALGRLAMIICMDAYFFETFRLAALQGADVVTFLTNSSGGSLVNLQTRAAENGVYVVSANRSDEELGYSMKGASAIWHPEGKILREAGLEGEEIVFASIEPENYQNRNKLLLDERKPELYQSLVLHISPWNYRKNQTSHEVTAAVLQYEPVAGDKVSNRKAVARLADEVVEKARQKGLKLDMLVLPELSFTGPVDTLTVEEIRALAEPTAGEKTGVFGEGLDYASELASSLDVNIVFGLVERHASCLYNTAVLLGRQGQILARYRKTHLTGSDARWAVAGDEFVVAHVEGLGCIGLAIGHDAVFPEVATILAVKGADMVALPACWAGETGGAIAVNPALHPASGSGMYLWDSRARDNCFYLLVANYAGTGQGYLGGSGIYGIDPIYGLDRPQVLAASNDVLVTTIKTLQKQWWYHQDLFIACRRKDESYYPLLKQEVGDGNTC